MNKCPYVLMFCPTRFWIYMCQDVEFTDHRLLFLKDNDLFHCIYRSDNTFSDRSSNSKTLMSWYYEKSYLLLLFLVKWRRLIYYVLLCREKQMVILFIIFYSLCFMHNIKSTLWIQKGIFWNSTTNKTKQKTVEKKGLLYILKCLNF